MSKLPTIILITGPCSSGKSEFAEALAAKNKQVTYVATAQIDDSGDRAWQTKITKHQQRRPEHWQTVAASSQLSTYIEAVADECLLIDSLGTWVANFLESDGVEWQQISDRFLASLQNSRGKIIIVGEETGWGVVPAYPSGRLFRDRLGYLSRQVGNIASTTYLVTGGHVLNLSLLGEPLSKYGI